MINLNFYRHFENSAESMESESALKNASGDEEEVDTDLETDRLLGHQRLEDHGFYDDKVNDFHEYRLNLKLVNSQNWCDRKQSRSSKMSKFSPKTQQTKQSVPSATASSIIRQGLNALLPTTPENSTTSGVGTVSAAVTTTTTATGNNANGSTSKLLDIGGSLSSPEHSEKSPTDAVEMPLSNESPTGSNTSNKVCSS